MTSTSSRRGEGDTTTDDASPSAELVLPDDFDDYAWEVEAKGCLLDATVRWSDRDFSVSFYDPARLTQDVTADLERSSATSFGRLVVLQRLTLEAMRSAARDLPPSFFAASGA